jgi:hypothetical protein
MGEEKEKRKKRNEKEKKTRGNRTNEMEGGLETNSASHICTGGETPPGTNVHICTEYLARYKFVPSFVQEPVTVQ